MRKLLIIALLMFPVAVSAQVQNPLWKLSSGALVPVSSSWTVGNSSTNATFGTLTISQIVLGALDMGGYNINDAGTVTARNFVATSTTATSTIVSGFTVGTNQFLVQQGSGNVGIGTTTPAQELSVQGDGLFSGNVYAANLIATGTLSMAYASTTSITSTGYAAFATSGGNVGIGSTTPNNLLSLGSGATPTSPTDRKTIELAAGGYGLPGAQNANSNGDKIILYRSQAAGYDGTIGVGSNSDMWFKSTGSGANFRWYNGTAPTLAMILDGSGNVGIGTTTPSRTLSVQGSALMSGDISAANLTATGTLTIGSTLGATGLATFSAGIVSNLIKDTQGFSRVTISPGAGSGTVLNLGGAGTSDFTGKLGISTSTPYVPLTVQGDAYFASSTASKSAGIILQDSDAPQTCHRITVNAAGTIAATAVACPPQ